MAHASLRPQVRKKNIRPARIWNLRRYATVTRQRNIFKQSWQKRTDLSIVKVTKLTERVSARFSFDVFNLTNTASFDIPIDEVTQNENFNGFPMAGTPARPTACDQTNAGFYNCPTSLGIVNKTIGSPRQVQMTLRLPF